MENEKTLMACVAHPGDFVWRAGGALALMKAQGWRTHVVCATYGTKGEAGVLWKEPGATEEGVAAKRRSEAEAAAALGAGIEFLELKDYPLVPTQEAVVALNRSFRDLRPDIVLTHPDADPGNSDHPAMSQMVMQARMFALAPGYGADMARPFSVYYFEPHQPELCSFRADHMLDISDVWETKYAAFQEIKSQRSVWDYYERVAVQRGMQAGRRTAALICHAEAYQKVLPTVGRNFQ